MSDRKLGILEECWKISNYTSPSTVLSESFPTQFQAYDNAGSSCCQIHISRVHAQEKTFLNGPDIDHIELINYFIAF